MARNPDKRPTEPFNVAAEDAEVEIVFDSDMDDSLNQDEEPQRGNTDPKHDPKNERNRGYTPTGSGPPLKATSGRSQTSAPSQPKTPQKEISDEEWQHRLRNGNHTFEDEFNGLRVRTWMAGEPSKDNIHGAHISEMIVTEGEYGLENVLAHFESGDWEVPMDATPERQAVASAVEKYDGEYLKKQRERDRAIQEKQNNKDKDPDRGR